MPHLWASNIRNDIVGGLVSAAVAIPLAMGFGMFALVSLGDKYLANGALAGLCTAFFVGSVSVLLGDNTTTVYAPRINSTFFWERSFMVWSTPKLEHCKPTTSL
jgi:SulP family sulfate permease